MSTQNDSILSGELILRPDLSSPLELGDSREVTLHLLADDGETAITYVNLLSIKLITPATDLVLRYTALGHLPTGEDVECFFVFDDSTLTQQVDITSFTPADTGQ